MVTSIWNIEYNVIRMTPFKGDVPIFVDVNFVGNVEESGEIRKGYLKR